MSKRASSQANLLREMGYPALGYYNLDGAKALNPIACYSPNKDLYNRIWTQYDLNQYCSSMKWGSLPNGLTSWNLNRMLYFRGTLCGFSYGGQVYILPYSIKGMINPYGLPTEVYPITFNGRPVAGKNDFFGEDFALPVDINGDLIKADPTGNYAFLLYDSIPYSPASKSPSRYFLNQVVIKEIVETLARININIVVSSKKILLVVKDPSQAAVAQKELEIMFGSDSPFGVLSSTMDIQDIQTTNDFNADDLFNTVKNWDAIRCFMNGIASKNFGSEKKERLVSGELQGNEEQVDLVADMRLELAQLFADQMNEAFGTGITCELRREAYNDDVNGRGNTKEDEEAML